MLHKHIGTLRRFNREVLLQLHILIRAKGRISEDDIIAVFFLYIGNPRRQRICAQIIRRIHAVQDHIHQANDIGQRRLLLTVKGFALQRVQIRR